MTETTFAVLGLLVLGWAVTSYLLVRVNITGPMVFTVAGFALGNPDWGPLAVDVDAPSVHVLAEVTLALLLFADAARMNVEKLRQDIMLRRVSSGIGLPLSMLLGSLLAAWLFDDLRWALAGFVGATLAPTDAALSAQVVDDQRIPVRLRRALNVESGLNDGIVPGRRLHPRRRCCGARDQRSRGRRWGRGAAGARRGACRRTGRGRGKRRHHQCSVRGGAGSSPEVGDWRRSLPRSAASPSPPLSGAMASSPLLRPGWRSGRCRTATSADGEASGEELPELVGEVLALAVWFLFGAALVPVAFHFFDLSMLCTRR